MAAEPELTAKKLSQRAVALPLSNNEIEMSNTCEFWIKNTGDAKKVSEIEDALRPALEPLSRQGYYGHAFLNLERLDPGLASQGQEWIGLGRYAGEPCFRQVEGGLVLAGACEWAPPLVFACWLADRFEVEVECDGTTELEYYERWLFAPGREGRLFDAYTEWQPDEYKPTAPILPLGQRPVSIS